MNVTLIGHASILVRTRGVTLLSDPWWRGPCFGAQWWNYPAPSLESLAGRTVDYIYVSHGHHDHFHPGTLNTLSKSAKVIVAAKTGLGSSVRKLGFEVIEVGEDQVLELAGGLVKCRIMETHGDDTLMCIDDGSQVCVNLNDALHSAPRSVQRRFVTRLKALYPKIDYVFCGYGVASHFPNCYAVPGKDDKATAARRQEYFNFQWARLIAELGPRFGFPFAADVAFLENDLFWINEVAHNCERPTEAFQKNYRDSVVSVLDIAPGFEIENGEVKAPVFRRRLRSSELRKHCAEEIARANRVPPVREESVNDLVRLLEKSVAARCEYLTSFRGNYRLLIRFRGAEQGVLLEKASGAIRVIPTNAQSTEDYDLVYTTRLTYVRLALTQPYGDEILFVGSGGIFRYPSERQAKRNIHRELIIVLRASQNAPLRRPETLCGAWHVVKQMLKRVLGRKELDLYDLGEWTVRKTPAASGMTA
jgi:hypothetical protein